MCPPQVSISYHQTRHCHHPVSIRQMYMISNEHYYYNLIQWIVNLAQIKYYIL